MLYIGLRCCTVMREDYRPQLELALPLQRARMLREHPLPYGVNGPVQVRDPARGLGGEGPGEVHYVVSPVKA